MWLWPWRARLVPGMLLASMLAMSLWLEGCLRRKEEDYIHRMGERVQVGPLIYTVLETEWMSQLGQSIQPRIPKDKFLLVRVEFTNSGNREVAVPLLRIEDGHGNSFMELSEGEGVSDWLGLLRVVPPAQTLRGFILFDAPPGEYRLRVTDAGDIEQEKTALIGLPLRLGSDKPVAPLPPPLPQ
jgi:hypothetical protein